MSAQHDNDINSPPSQPQPFGGYYSPCWGRGVVGSWFVLCMTKPALTLPFHYLPQSCVCDQPSPTTVYTLSNQRCSETSRRQKLHWVKYLDFQHLRQSYWSYAATTWTASHKWDSDLGKYFQTITIWQIDQMLATGTIARITNTLPQFTNSCYTNYYNLSMFLFKAMARSPRQ